MHIYACVGPPCFVTNPPLKLRKRATLVVSKISAMSWNLRSNISAYLRSTVRLIPAGLRWCRRLSWRSWRRSKGFGERSGHRWCLLLIKGWSVDRDSIRAWDTRYSKGRRLAAFQRDATFRRRSGPFRHLPITFTVRQLPSVHRNDVVNGIRRDVNLPHFFVVVVVAVDALWLREFR